MPYQRKRTPIGQRHERLIIQRLTSTDDGIGGQSSSWETVVRTWASVVPLDERSKEAVEGGQLTGVHNYHFDIRYRTAEWPQPADRFVWRGRTLEVRTVVDDEALNRRLIVQASEVQDSHAAS